MINEITVGDDYTNTCPHCLKKISMGHLSRDKPLFPGLVANCSSCGKKFEIAKIDYIPNVYLRKYESY